MEKIILASNSPRRKEILTKGKIDFSVIKSNYKEESFKFYNEDFIKKNSLNKALDVAKRLNYAATVIGADTMVILEDGSVCLKPQNFKEAFLMLKNLSGNVHKVVTSISLVQSETGKNLTEIEETFVTFRVLLDGEIKEYIEKFNPQDKAGSYGIQDFLREDGKISPEFSAKMPGCESFITKIEGDYYNVMGISLEKLRNMYKNF